MKKFSSLALFLAANIYMPAALAADASVTISSPANGAKISSAASVPVTYEVMPGPKGDHTHIYVDGNQKAVLMKLKDTHTLDALTKGKHDICIKIVNKAHSPIGVEQCVSVTAE